MSLVDDPSRDRNLEAARLNLRMKDGEIKLTVSIKHLSVHSVNTLLASPHAL